MSPVSSGQDDAAGPFRRDGRRARGLVPGRTLGCSRAGAPPSPRGRVAGGGPRSCGRWEGLESAAATLDGWSGGRALLVIDDLHALEGTAAEGAIGRFVDYAPAWLAVLVGTRVVPDFNLSRLRVSGELLEIGSDDLRFRAWEVEQLFREFYREPVPPAELAVLARRTEGWAAGLQLFHLATRGNRPRTGGACCRASGRAAGSCASISPAMSSLSCPTTCGGSSSTPASWVVSAGAVRPTARTAGQRARP